MYLSVVDLFSGAGGLSEGFRQAGFRILAGSDHDPDACATYTKNFPEAKTIKGDIRATTIRDTILKFASECDVIIGGPPCQAFSQVRNHVRVIDDPRNSLYREFVGIVTSIMPKAFLMENVPGLDQMGVHEQILEDLSIGDTYEVCSHLLDAANFGVPQSRKRLLFFGIRKELGIPLPRITEKKITDVFSLQRIKSVHGYKYQVESTYSLFPIVEHRCLSDDNDLAATTVEQAIGDLVLLTEGRREDSINYNELPKPTSAYQRLMRDTSSETLYNVQVPRMNKDTLIRLSSIPEGGNYRDLPEEYQKRYITGEKWGPNNGSGKLGRKHFYAYRRLHKGIWAWTLNTKGDSVYHYLGSRSLSVREFARLQSFPDRFVFTTDPFKGEMQGRISDGAAHSRYRQVGNAVPPMLAKQVAMAIKNTLQSAEKINTRTQIA